MSNLIRLAGSVIAIGSAVLASGSAFGADKLGWALRTGFDLGGDRLQRVPYTDGTYADIRAGNGLYFSGGVSYAATPRLGIDATIGFEFSSATGSNGDITWSYFPVDVIALYKTGIIAFGGGVTYHLSPSLSGSGVLSSVQKSFDDAMGYILEGDYQFTDQAVLGLRYTSIDYKAPGITKSGNSVGLTFRFGV